MIDCTFSGRLKKVVFYGRLGGIYTMESGQRLNEFRGNDFSGADLAQVEFRWGIDLSRQVLPTGSDYVYLPDSAATLARLRLVVDGWPEADRRRRAVMMIEIFEREVTLGQTQALLRVSEWVRNEVDAEVVDLLRSDAANG
ncbi:hypothetical protein K1W54_13985 [Micromonospora sp. CPCC 205371]|nr:hypothetical protein [Micromonospora sp. CPCC 205371]